MAGYRYLDEDDGRFDWKIILKSSNKRLYIYHHVSLRGDPLSSFFCMIGLISLGINSLSLLPPLRYGNKQLITLLDMTMSNHDEYHYDAIGQRLHQHCTWLINQGCTHLILPPLRELIWQSYDPSTAASIMPLFHSYTRYALTYSLVGKIGRIMSTIDSQLWTRYTIQNTFLSHPMTDQQKQTKRFAHPRQHRSISVPHRCPLLRYLPTRDMMLTKQIKHDVRPLKDAGVDTIIPCQWGFFSFHRSFRTIFQSKQYRLHPITIATNIISSFSHPQSFPNTYTLAILGNDSILSHPHWKFVTGCHRDTTKPTIHYLS
ncbi:MAG: hypothetical protein NZL83_00960 [Candidatus Absconditabacterales bacterium]|nr:hypothetical protein [Candidatus Absconditabacterales bacterium]